MPLDMQPRLLSILRVAIALTFSQHAVIKVLGCSSIGCIPQPFTPVWLSGIAEIMLGSMLLFGLASRSVALLLAGVTAIAYFTTQMQPGFFLDDGKLAIVYGFAFLYLAVAGPGPWSIDGITATSRVRAR